MDARIIQTKLERIKQSSVLQRWPITGWEGRTADYVAVGDYCYDGDWQPVADDSFWPPTKTLFLRAQATTPEGVSAQNLQIEFAIQDMEGLLTMDGRPYAGIDWAHARVPVLGVGQLALEAEFICVAAAGWEPQLMNERARLRGVSFVELDPAAQAAYYDLWFAWEASKSAKDERRRTLLHAALEEALLAVDLRGTRAQLGADLARARESSPGVWARLRPTRRRAACSSPDTRTSTWPGCGRCARRCASAGAPFPPPAA